MDDRNCQRCEERDEDGSVGEREMNERNSVKGDITGDSIEDGNIAVLK